MSKIVGESYLARLNSTARVPLVRILEERARSDGHLYGLVPGPIVFGLGGGSRANAGVRSMDSRAKPRGTLGFGLCSVTSRLAVLPSSVQSTAERLNCVDDSLAGFPGVGPVL
jgi:hypothetical protein